MECKGVLGIGNALVDIMTPITEDSLLDSLGLERGSMTLVDVDSFVKVQSKIADMKSQITTGGAVANSVRGVANLGVKSGFIGSIAEDEKGKFFRDSLHNLGIETFFKRSSNSTGAAVALVSGDGERTFATHLGAAIELTAKDLNPEVFRGFKYFHIEGYLVQNHELILTAAMMAKDAGLKIALDMASFNVVEGNMDVLNILVDEYVDILFANEEEAKSFSGLEPEEAVIALAKRCEIAVVKVGAKGALIESNGDKFSVEAYGGAPVDTTGAGDLFAAGFMSGLDKGYSLKKSAKLGSILGGTVISVLGAHIPEEKWSEIRELEANLKE